MDENWTPPTPVITVEDTYANRSLIKAECPECGHSEMTTARTEFNATVVGERVIRDHLETHAPWHAPDVEVSWEPQASCSTCEDGGNVELEGPDAIVCSTCGTMWDIDGTCGERITS